MHGKSTNLVNETDMHRNFRPRDYSIEKLSFVPFLKKMAISDFFKVCMERAIIP